MRLIDADQILRHKRHLLGSDCWMGSEHTISAVPVEVIDTTPTIDAAPVVHGRWVRAGKDKSVIVCNMCSIVSCLEHMYCPHCGARMDADAPERVGEGQ